MMSDVLAPRHDDQILGSVVGLDVVQVMDDLAAKQGSAEHPFHDETVLENVALRRPSGWVIRRVFHDVTLLMNVRAALPVVMALATVTDRLWGSIAVRQVEDARHSQQSVHPIDRDPHMPSDGRSRAHLSIELSKLDKSWHGDVVLGFHGHPFATDQPNRLPVAYHMNSRKAIYVC